MIKIVVVIIVFIMRINISEATAGPPGDVSLGPQLTKFPTWKHWTNSSSYVDFIAPIDR